MKRNIVIVAAMSAVIALAGCGSSSGSTGAGNTSTSSAAAAAAVKAGDAVDLAPIMKKASAAVLAKKTGHMTMAMAQASIVADVKYDGAATAMKMSMDAAGQKLEMIFVGKVMYMGGAMAAQLGGGKKWVKIDANGTDPLSKQLAPMLQQMSTVAQNPTQALSSLQGVKATVASVDGSNTTYAVTLTKAEIEQMLKATGVTALGSAAKSASPDSMSYTITLDGDSLPVEVVTKMSGVDVTMNMSRWGQPVDITAPPASQVGTFTMPGMPTPTS